MPKFSKFSVAEGADPMGIGVPYYGESSFDPVEFVRRQWDETRARKAAGAKAAQAEQEQFQEFMEQVPSYEQWEQATSEQLNKQVHDLQTRMLDSYSQGEFDPYARDEEGHLKWDKEMRNLQGQMDMYQAMGEKYKANWDALQKADPERVDQELTQQRFSQMMEEPTMEGKAQMLHEPLVVFRPEPIEVIDELTKGFRLFIPDREIEITSEDFDERTGLLRKETIEKIDPKKLDRAMGQIWDTLSDRVKNEFERKYESAPEWQKTARIDGESMPMDMEDWFKAQYSPEFAKKMGVTYHTRPKAETKLNWNMVLPGKRPDGTFELDPFRETVAMGTKGEIHNVNSEASIPLQEAFKKAFVMPTTPNTVDNTTGEVADQAKAVATLPVSVNISPVAKETFDYTDAEGNIVTFDAGEVIPGDVQRSLDRQGLSANYMFESFLLTKVDYQRVPTITFMIDDIPLNEKIQSFGQTQRTPLREARRYLEAAGRHDDLDVAPLFETVTGILNQLNQFDDIFGKGRSEEEIYQQLFD